MNRTLSRQERRKLRTRQRILDAARRVIAARGYEATGVLDITEAADVSKGTFYLYFKDKEDLTRTLIMEGFKALRAHVINDLLPTRTHVDELSQGLRAVFHYANQNRDLFRIMLGRKGSAELSLMALNYYAEAVEEILGLIGLTPDVLPLPPALLAQFIAGAGTRLVLWWLEDDHGLSPDQMSEITYRLLREGLLPLMPPHLRAPQAAG